MAPFIINILGPQATLVALGPCFLKTNTGNVHMNIRQQIVQTCLAWVILGAFLALLNPGGLPVVLLIVPFLLLFAALYLSWRLIRCIRVTYFAYDGTSHRHLGTVVCATIVLLLVLQSLGQLSLRDVITVGAIIGLGYVYVGRTALKLPGR